MARINSISVVSFILHSTSRTSFRCLHISNSLLHFYVYCQRFKGNTYRQISQFDIIRNVHYPIYPYLYCYQWFTSNINLHCHLIGTNTWHHTCLYYTLLYTAGKTLHGKMEGRIIILDSIDKITNSNLHLQFLTNLTEKRVLVAPPQAIRKVSFGRPEGG